uniref:Uncharacterized protein n=1 Tax=Vitis vinifera TaxID=29760 RepID=F6HPQ7_VITVI
MEVKGLQKPGNGRKYDGIK